MGIDVKLDLNAALPVLVDRAVALGGIEAGHLIIEAANARAPKEEGEPRHGEHMVDTSYVRPLTLDAVELGYGAFWSVWQEVKDEYDHAEGQRAHFLESALLELAAVAFERWGEVIRAESAL